MNFLSFVRISVAFALSLIAFVVNAQYPGGTGTTGATDGSGRGTGSAGVQTGGGPDTSQSTSPQPLNIFAPRQEVTTTSTTTNTTSSEGSKKKSQTPRKHSKKTTKQSQTTASPSPSASPR